jgi:hypothetical protein
MHSWSKAYSAASKGLFVFIKVNCKRIMTAMHFFFPKSILIESVKVINRRQHINHPYVVYFSWERPGKGRLPEIMFLKLNLN